MKIYFAGLSGASNLSRFEGWIKAGLQKKLISYYEVSIGDGKIEWEKILNIKKGE